MNRFQLLKIALAASNTRLVDLAREWGVTHPSIIMAAQGKQRSRRLEAKIDAYCTQILRTAGIDISRKAA